MTQIEANGITIDYEITGEGDPLLMIMGLGSQRISWPEGFVDEFTGRGYQVIQFDNRDAGLSTEFDGPAPYPAAVVMARLSGETPDVPYRLADMADDTAALLDGLGIGSTHVLGVSMGGMIAQELAIRHPQRVRSLTSIMSTTGDPSVGGVAPDLMGRLDELTATSIDHAVERSVAMW
ncbi:MAG: alpha/beta hydrolase, partial [Acidimicrobiales bacterium]|nr:alpha/beta hydrolase [Acidimicrobiales bacterium]